MMKVSDVMTKRVISIRPEATILEAIKVMLKNHISGMPAIDGKEKLVGILTEGDFQPADERCNGIHCRAKPAAR